MIAAVAAVLSPHSFAGRPGECFEGLRCDARPGALDRILGALCVGASLIPDRLQLRNSVLQHRVGEIGAAVLDRIVNPLELGVCLGPPLAQFGDMRRSALRALLAAVAPMLKRPLDRLLLEFRMGLYRRNA